jgi:VCBS repeat-containing protein
MAVMPKEYAIKWPSRWAVVLLGLTSTSLWAAGFAPFARNDSATVTRGGTVSVLDSGQTSVLANDFDIERDRLTARLRKDVKHGTLTLNPNGTFVYRHDGGNKDRDQFEYRAFDGTRESRNTKVTIRITPGDPDPIAPVIVGQDPIDVPEDESVEIRLTDLKVEDPDSRFPQEFTLAVRNGDNYERVDNTILPAPNYNGALTVPVRVSDGSNNSNIFNLVVEVTPVNDGPFVTGDVPDQVAQEDVAFELRLSDFFADEESNIVEYRATGLPPGGSLALDQSTGLLTGTPILSDARDQPYVVSVTAQDSGRLNARLEFILRIFPRNRADLALTLKVTPQPAQIGESVQWELQVDNLGPADLEEGILRVDWFSSDPPLDLATNSGCTVQDNESQSPAVECLITNLAADTSTTILVESEQSLAGDSTAIATVTAEDPDTSNNTGSSSLNVAANFAEGAAQTLGSASVDVASGDLDADGFMDLVVTGSVTNIFWNTGERRLSDEATSLDSPASASAVVLLDWNMDGALDVAVTNGADEPSMVYLNAGDRQFDNALPVPGLGARQVAAGAVLDLNNDGAAELVLSGSNGTVIFGNDGQGGFSSSVLDLQPGRDVSGSDLNQDGFSDVVVTSAVDRAVSVFTNDGNGDSFSVSVLREGSVSSVTTTDVNGDGTSDLLLAVDGEDLQVPISRVLANDGAGGFSLMQTLGASPTARLLAGDLDQDGRQDIFAVKQTGVHQLFASQEGSGFELGPEQIVSAGMFQGILVDINADQSLDLILAGRLAGAVEVHFNNGNGRFGPGDITPPTITLVGDTSISLAVGDLFEDPGATAMDDIDGDLTDSLLVDNPVNTALVGTYTVTYTVADRAGNVSEVPRTVRVTAVTGVGGGGGGAISIYWLLLCGCLAALGRHMLQRNNLQR